jgi:hypothetical protein
MCSYEYEMIISDQPRNISITMEPIEWLSFKPSLRGFYIYIYCCFLLGYMEVQEENVDQVF